MYEKFQHHSLLSVRKKDDFKKFGSPLVETARFFVESVPF